MEFSKCRYSYNLRKKIKMWFHFKKNKNKFMIFVVGLIHKSKCARRLMDFPPYLWFPSIYKSAKMSWTFTLSKKNYSIEHDSALCSFNLTAHNNWSYNITNLSSSSVLSVKLFNSCKNQNPNELNKLIKNK